MRKGQVKEEMVREMAKPLFYTRMRLGEFDPPTRNPYSRYNIDLVQSYDHRELAVEAAMKSFVLLKYEDIYLQPEVKLILIERKYKMYKKIAVSIFPLDSNAKLNVVLLSCYCINSTILHKTLIHVKLQRYEKVSDTSFQGTFVVIICNYQPIW